MKSQPRLLYRSQRKAPLDAALVLDNYGFISRLAFDADDDDLIGAPSRCISRHVRRDDRLAAGEPSPVRRVSERPLQTRRGDFEGVLPLTEPLLVQPCFDRP